MNNYETKLDLALKSFSEESPTYEEKFRALPPHERVLQDKSFIDKTRSLSKIIQDWEGPDYFKQTPRQMIRDRKSSTKEIEKLKKTNEYENFLADREAVFIKPIEDAYEEAKANKTLRKYPSFYIDDSIKFVDIGKQKPFPDPDVLDVYVDDKGYAIGAITKYKGKDMSVTTPTHPYEKLRYLPLEVQNKLFDEVLTPGIPKLRAKYPKINDLYADLDPRDKKEFKAYAKEINSINKRSKDAYNFKKQDYVYQLEFPIIDNLMKEALKSSIDEAYERAKKEGTLLK